MGPSVACMHGMRVSPSLLFPRIHIPRDACFPTHAHIPNALSSTSHRLIVKCVSLGILFPNLHCANLATTQLASYWAMHDVIR